MPLSLFRSYPLPFSPPFPSILVPYPSFSSMSFTLIYICCSFRGGILSVVFRHCSHMFLTRREPGVPLSLFRPYPLPFSPPFLLYVFLTLPSFSMSFSLIYICCSFRGGILSVVFPTVAICFWPAGNPGVPLSLFRSYPLPFSPSFSSILFLTLPFLPYLLHWSISAVVSGEAFYLLFSPL